MPTYRIVNGHRYKICPITNLAEAKASRERQAAETEEQKAYWVALQRSLQATPLGTLPANCPVGNLPVIRLKDFAEQSNGFSIVPESNV